jgi:hypothetical protein
MESLKRAWAQSKAFRVFLIIAILWFVLRFVFQIAYQSNYGEGWFLADDMQAYKSAAERLVAHTDIYRPEEMQTISAFQYAPSYALAYFPLTRLPVAVLSVGWMVLQTAAYALLWLRWNALFSFLELKTAKSILARTLPIWLIFSTFWADLAYANVYIIMALLATLLIEAVLKHRLGWSILWSGIILQIKPQWAFALFIPLCLREWKFLLKVTAGAMLFYLGCLGAGMLVVGPSYLVSQDLAYFRFMLALNSYFPWTKLPFLGYNHSVLQTVIHFVHLPYSAVSVGTAALIKTILLAPLVWISWQFGRSARTQAQAVMLALAWYLAIFILMDVIWEVTLALPILALIWPALRNIWERGAAGVLIGVYAALDIWQTLSYMIWGDAILWQGNSYVLSDPAVYVPIILLVLLALYAALLRDLSAGILPGRQGVSQKIETIQDNLPV